MRTRQIQDYEMTDDHSCPYCDEEGRDKQNACRFHQWCSLRWFQRWRVGLAR
jgi:hypothetical protein